MAAGSQPLAFAELAFGGILLTSAITGESVGELLTNGLTAAGKARLHAKGGSGGEALGQGSPESLGGSGGLGPSLEPGHSAPAGSTAPAPGKVGATVGSHPSNTKRLSELKHGLEVALNAKQGLEKQITERKITKSQAEKTFAAQYPWYSAWYYELKALLK